MIVFRIEHASRCVGPWTWQRNYAFTKAWRRAKQNRPPEPKTDTNGRHIRPDEHVGCESMEQLLHWFEGVMDWLRDNHFCIKVFETDECTVLGNQVLVQTCYRTMYRNETNIIIDRL